MPREEGSRKMTRRWMSVGVALGLALAAGSGWALHLDGDQVTTYGPPPEVGDTVYMFSVDFHDSEGPIDYFGDPFCVSDSTGLPGMKTDRDDMHPRVVMDGDGNAHVVWMSNESPDRFWEICYCVVAPDGAILIQREWISDWDDGKLSTYPAIALDSNRDIHIVWADERGGAWEIYYQKVRPHLTPPYYAELLTDENMRLSDLDGFDSGRYVDPYAEEPRMERSFGTQEKYQDIAYKRGPYDPNDLEFIEHPDICVDPDDYVHVVWSDKRDGFWNVYYQKQTNDPIPQVLINDTAISDPAGPFDACSPAICVGAELDPNDYSIHIAWQQSNYWGEWSVWYRKQHSTTGEYIVPNIEVSDDQAHDGRHSASPDLSADESDYVHVAFMTNREMDPGHDPTEGKEDIHIDGQWEVYLLTLKPADGPVEKYRDPKRESDLTNSPWPPDPEWDIWGDPVYGYYTGPGSPIDLPDGPSVYPRIVSQGPFACGKTRVVWHDYRWASAPEPEDWRSWEIYYTEVHNRCKNPHEDVRLTDNVDPDMYAEVHRAGGFGPDVKWQRKAVEGDWNAYNSRWKLDSGGEEEYIRLVITVCCEEYCCYRVNPTDEDASGRGGIAYIWTMPLLPGEYTYHFEAKRGEVFAETGEQSLVVQ
jgi:hypothetical protein